jgi:hypothetical protein
MRTVRDFILTIIHLIILSDGRDMWRVWGKGEVCTGFWLGNLRERDHWGDPDVDGRIILDASSGSGRQLWGLDGVGS